jgi:methylglutaconyl-CoA hydratase
MQPYSCILVEKRGGVLVITLNRPEIGNAFNSELIRELTGVFGSVGEEVRAVVLTGAGKVFCAGADLNWMKRMAEFTQEENYADARALDQMFYTIDVCPKPVVAKVNGAAIAGGMGFLGVSDVVIASTAAKFGFTEVNLGIVPAVVSPYVMPKIGYSQTRSLFVSAEIFSAEKAKEIGLVHETVEPELLDARVDARLKDLSKGGSSAQAVCKKWLRELKEMDIVRAREESARLIAGLRVSPEGQEGMRAFLEKRKPAWIVGDE